MWYVQLIGDQLDLSTLAQSLAQGPVRISREGDDYYLVIADVGSEQEPRAVMARANEIVELINGAASLALDTIPTLRTGSIHLRREDGGRHHFLLAEAGVLRLRGFAPTIVVSRSDGSVEVSRPADPVADWFALARDDETVANVLRLLGASSNGWVNLYRIFEIIAADVGGIGAIADRGWGARSSMGLFKRTANSPGAVGLEARHGSETTDPPKDPMNLNEAQALVRRIADLWLKSKL
jgi:hypothetical protein